MLAAPPLPYPTCRALPLASAPIFQATQLGKPAAMQITVQKIEMTGNHPARLELPDFFRARLQ